MVGPRPVLVHRPRAVWRAGGARHARSRRAAAPRRLQAERSERRRSCGPPRGSGRPGPGRGRGRRAGERLRVLAPNGRRRRVCGRAAAARLRRVPGGARAAAVRDAIARDNTFRRAVLQGGERSYLLDYAGDAMRLAGLSLLQIQDETGRIVSSGHFRNEYDRSDPALPRLLATAPAGSALVEARTAEAPFLALARVDSLPVASRRFTLVGGMAADPGFLARLTPDSELTVAVALPADTTAVADPATQVVSSLDVPFVTAGDSARL